MTITTICSNDFISKGDKGIMDTPYCSCSINGENNQSGKNGSEGIIEQSPSYFKWLYDIHDIARRGGSPSEILSIATQVIPYQMVLFDGSFSLIAYEANGQDIPTSMQEALRNGYAMGVSAEHQRQYRKRFEESPKGFELVFDGDEVPVPLWVQPIETLSGKKYFLHVMKMNSGDGVIRRSIDELVLELSIVLDRMEYLHSPDQFEDLVQSLVTNHFTVHEIQERSCFFGWENGSSYQVIRILSIESYIPVLRWEQHARELDKLFFNVHTSVMEDGLTLLAFNNVHAHNDDVIFDIAALNQYAQECNLAVGMSDSRYNLEEVPEAYQEACEAAFLIVKENEHKNININPFAVNSLNNLYPTYDHVYTYDECKYSLMLETLGEYANEHNIVPNCLKLLNDHDEHNGTEYIKTLMTYLRCLMNKTKTCSLLNIHRTTLDYRLDQIDAISHINLENEAQRYELLLLCLITKN